MTAEILLPKSLCDDGGWWWWWECKPILVFSLSLSQAEQKHSIVFVLGSVQELYKYVREGWGSEGIAYFAYVVRAGGGSRGKMLMLLMQRIKILNT